MITEHGALDGIPMSIGGRDKTKHIQLADGDRLYTGIDVTSELGAKISGGKCLFRKVIRLHGIGRWHRTIDGEWELKKFKAESYEVLDETGTGSV